MKAAIQNSTDEAELVSRCKNNVAAAQKVLYARYAEDMMFLCLRYIPQQQDAREVLMDSFLSFFRNIHGFSYQGEGSLKAWLKKIVVNNCLAHLRKRNPFLAAAREQDYNEHPAPGDTILGQLTVKEIMQMIHTLPDGYRTVFNLYVFEGMNHREIGEMLGITESTSKSQLHRARVILKKKYCKQAKMPL